MNPIRTGLVALVSVALVALGSPPAGAEPSYSDSRIEERTKSTPDGTAQANAYADMLTGSLQVHAEASATGLAAGLGYVGLPTRADAVAHIIDDHSITEGTWDVRAVISDISGAETVDSGDFALPYGLDFQVQHAYAGLFALVRAFYLCMQGCGSGGEIDLDGRLEPLDPDPSGEIVLTARIVVPEGQSGNIEVSVGLGAYANVHGEASAEASASGVVSDISVTPAS